MVKEFLYKGKTLEQLKEMGIEEFARLVPARQRRSLLRRKMNEKLLKKVMKTINQKEIKPVRTHLRDLIIIPQMVGGRIAVYNGKEFIPVEIEKEMIGHFLGEFALTRKRVKHGKAGIGATKSSTAIVTRK